MLKEFLRDKSVPHLLMLAAIVLLLVSQFFPYFDDKPRIGVSDASLTEITFLAFEHFGTGWQLHPQAYPILVVLAFAFLRSEIYESKWFRLVGWWLAVGLIAWASWQGAPFRAVGAAMGWIAVLMSLGAAVLNMFWKTAKPGAAARRPTD